MISGDVGMYDDMKNYIITKYKEGNNVRTHITKVDYDSDVKYDTVCGVYINEELDEVFELTQITNDEIDVLMKEIDDMIRRNTVYLI